MPVVARRGKMLLVTVTACLACSGKMHAAVITLDDGAVHDIVSTWQDIGITVRDEPFFRLPTTVNLLETAQIAHANVEGTSTINILGGTVDARVVADEAAVLTMSSGFIGGNVLLGTHAIFSVTGGTIAGDITRYTEGSDGDITIAAGEIYGKTYALRSATIEVSGGALFGGLSISESATGRITGGVICDSIGVGDSARLTIYGYAFKINGIDVPYGTYGGDRQGDLTGFVADGSSIAARLNISHAASVTFAEIPEPLSLMLMSFGMLLSLKRTYKNARP